MNFHTWTHDGDEVMILRRIPKHRMTYNNFLWPSGIGAVVECPDWKPNDKCGNGLHGWPWGFGLGDGCGYDIINDVWLVIGAAPEDVVGEIEGGAKCKFRRGTIRYEGKFQDAMLLLQGGFLACVEKAASAGVESTAASAGIESTAASAGDKSKAASAGNRSNAASAGNRSNAASAGIGSNVASAGNGSKAASSGERSKAASAGDWSAAASVGDWSKAASSGDRSKAASAGNWSTAASVGDWSTAASSGDWSKAASAGNESTAASVGIGSKAASAGIESKAASSGDRSKAASAGNWSTAASLGKDTVAAVAGTGRVRAGENGAIAVCQREADDSYRFVCGKIGEEGIKADTWYRAERGKLVECES